ncbi:hypothetical protein [Kiloniella sp.]|uniref:hypothetical protein n=1 Tax=Kiloniella sp. TaxID=1938587 RepID=UPI003B01A4C2
MNHSFEYEEFGTLITLRGSFNVEDIMGLHKNIYNHPKPDGSRYFIIDATKMAIVDETHEVPFVVPFSDRVYATYKPHMHVIFVSTDDDFIALYKNYRDNLASTDWIFKLFDTLEDARVYQNYIC